MNTNDNTPYNGKDLIAKGYKPAKWFGTAIENQWSFEQIEAHLASLPKILIREDWETKNAPLSVNLTAHTPLEKQNLASVMEAMNYNLKFPSVVGGALMPDSCPTGKTNIPVGGVIATEGKVYPRWHSADICCSLHNTIFVGATPAEVMEKAYEVTHFGKGGRDRFKMPTWLVKLFESNYFLSDFDTNTWWNSLVEFGHKYLGTQGDGNHFLYVGTPETDRFGQGAVALVTHHGSRGVGAKLFKKALKVAEKECKLYQGLDKNYFLDINTEIGREYMDALAIVRTWTKLNHEVIHNAIVEELGCEVIHQHWNEHNFVFERDGIVYHAKGATPTVSSLMLENPTEAIIPLNMAQPILVVETVGDDALDTPTMGFAPHGAGRLMSRTAFKKTLRDKTLEEVLATETEGIDARFYGSPDISELPSAYKDADKVQAEIASFGLANISYLIKPYGSIMAGE